MSEAQSPPSPQVVISSPKRGCQSSFGCLLSISIILNLLLFLGLASTYEKPRPQKQLSETWISGKGQHKIAFIHINGTIMGGSRPRNGVSPAQLVIQKLEQARRDPAVKGVLIQADSPGGSVTASDQIYHEMIALRKSGKPIVVLMGNTCASGCLYLAAPATKIYANPTTLTGSIGVIMSTLNFSKFLEQHGIKGVTIASKKNKALLSPFEPIKEEHKAILKKIIDELFARFAGILIKWRKIPKKELMKYADGRVFSATQALKFKLIDGIGYKQKALTSLLKLTKLSRSTVKIVRYHKSVGFSDLLWGYMQLPKHLKSSQYSLSIENLLRLKTPRAYYIWTAATQSGD